MEGFGRKWASYSLSLVTYCRCYKITEKLYWLITVYILLFSYLAIYKPVVINFSLFEPSADGTCQWHTHSSVGVSGRCATRHFTLVLTPDVPLVQVKGTRTWSFIYANRALHVSTHVNGTLHASTSALHSHKWIFVREHKGPPLGQMELRAAVKAPSTHPWSFFSWNTEKSHWCSSTFWKSSCIFSLLVLAFIKA